MRKILFLTILLAAALRLQGVEPEPFDRFLDACVQLRDGIADRDRYAVMDARSGFATVKAVPYPFYELKSGKLLDAAVRFNEVFCDSLIANGFEPVKLSELSGLREGEEDAPGGVYYFEASMAPGAAVAFSYMASNRCRFGLVGADASLPLTVELSNGEGKLNTKRRNGDTLHTADWQSDPYGEEINVSITNTSAERPATFVIAIK